VTAGILRNLWERIYRAWCGQQRMSEAGLGLRNTRRTACCAESPSPTR